MRRHVRWIAGLIAFLLAAMMLGLLLRVAPVAAWLASFNAWVENLGAGAPFVFGAAYVVATILLIPGSVLTLGAGAIFGLLWGTIVVMFAATIGALIAFLLARYAARDWATRRFAADSRFEAIDRAIARDGARLVLLLRLSPIVPFNVINYLLGLTAVDVKTYTVWSWLGMLPGTLLYVYLGHAGRRGLTLVAEGTGGIDGFAVASYLAGLAATIAVCVLLARLARRELRHEAAGTVKSTRER